MRGEDEHDTSCAQSTLKMLLTWRKKIAILQSALYLFSTLEPRSWLQFLCNFVLVITIIVFIEIINNNYTESSQVVFIPILP